jgi:hypothetical protein
MGEFSLNYGLCSYKNPADIQHLTKSLTKQQNTQNISKITNIKDGQIFYDHKRALNFRGRIKVLIVRGNKMPTRCNR